VIKEKPVLSEKVKKEKQEKNGNLCCLLLLPCQKHVGITRAQQMVENILDIVWHGRFPGMVLSGTSVELISGFQSTFRESTYW
jgi:hypothetical protein